MPEPPLGENEKAPPINFCNGSFGHFLVNSLRLACPSLFKKCFDTPIFLAFPIAFSIGASLVVPPNSSLSVRIPITIFLCSTNKLRDLEYPPEWASLLSSFFILKYALKTEWTDRRPILISKFTYPCLIQLRTQNRSFASYALLQLRVIGSDA